jgi:hypothetical protein
MDDVDARAEATTRRPAGRKGARSGGSPEAGVNGVEEEDGEEADVRWPTEDHVWFEDRWMVASLCDE